MIRNKKNKCNVSTSGHNVQTTQTAELWEFRLALIPGVYKNVHSYTHVTEQKTVSRHNVLQLERTMTQKGRGEVYQSFSFHTAQPACTVMAQRP